MTATERWERRLEREGLGSIDGDRLSRRGQVQTERHSTRRVVNVAEHSQATDAFLAWARLVLESHVFTGRRPRRAKRIWALYAEGVPLTDIVAEVGGSRRSVTKALARVKREAAIPPPVANPWRHWLPPTMEPNEVLRLVPPEDDEMPKGTPKLYRRILVRRGFGVYMPDRPRVELDTLIGPKGAPLEGTPHAGGIDIETGVEACPVVTVPWWKILQADLAGEAG